MTRNQKDLPAPAYQKNASLSTGALDSKLKTTPIAIIGIGSLFPQARSSQEYWDNILHKINCVSDVPDSRWKIEDYYDPNPSAPDKTYCKRGGFIPDVDFDPMEFGLPPNILEVTDVSQLLGLVVARDTLEDAGYGENRQFSREAVGCVLGVVGMSSKLFTPLMTRLQYPVWDRVLQASGISADDSKRIIERIKLSYVQWEENAFPGAIGNVIAGRICNRFDLGGVNCVLDAACASSLAAIKMAVGELIEGRADMMLTGGVDTDNSITTFMCFSKTPAFSKGDRVRTFDAESDGMMVGEGIGMVLLKRLADAERDGDRVYAVIKAIGTSSDGRFKSIYAPRSSGQAKALRRAYTEAGFEPATVGLIEAHGTGTMAGDPAEFEGIKEAFSENNPRKQHIALGSVKSQIAHTKAAAGVASLIKTTLALHHKILPPTINVTRPNPKFGIENSPFYVNTETRPWIRAKNGHPRRAGVSSFGFGGTNYHVVLEEFSAEHKAAYRLNTVAQPVLLAADTPAQLLAACQETLSKLQGEGALLNFAGLVEASRVLVVPQQQARVGFVAETADEAAQLLQIAVDSLSSKPQEENWEHPRGVFYRKSGLDPQGKLVALFSGQGSQYLEMGRELALNFPTVREVFGEMDALFLEGGLEPLSARVYPRPAFEAKEREAASDLLTRTDHAQPAIGSLSVGLYKLLEQAGFAPNFVAGHSFGELTALWAAGVLNDQDYYTLAKARGQAMAPPEKADFDAGTMVAVKGDVEKIRAALQDDPEVTLANWNSNDQMVIAGSKPVMERAQQQLNQQGFKTIPLPVSAAFHTPLVGHAQKPFAKAIRSVKFQAPKVRVYSNSTAQPHSKDPETIRTMLAEHILKPVLFRDEIENIYSAGGTIFVEFGPKNVLTNLVDNILAGRPHLAVALNANAKKDSDRQLREAVIALRVAGVALPNFDPYGAERKIIQRKKSPVTVKLNGGHYVSEKTRAAFENALNDGWRISQARSVEPVAAPAVAASAAPATPAPAPEPLPVISRPARGEPDSMNNHPSIHYEHALAEYQAHQSETLRLHEQYLRTEEEYARAFAQLTQLQSELVSKGSSDLQSVLPLFESLERSMTRFHDHQAETLRVHQRYLETQESFSHNFVQGIQGAGSSPAAPTAPASYATPAPIVTRPVEPPPAPKSNGGNGYNRPPAAAGESRPAPVVAAPAPVQPAAPAPLAQQPAPVVSAPAASLPAAPAGLDAAALKTTLLQIVSDKTGYPVETLELDMDMEADLGIDSIKRVEILGAMQSEFPSLPKIETNVLAELRTLGQIVNQMSASAPVAPAVVVADPEAPAPSQAAPTVSESAVNKAQVTEALLAIVSDKTGYPVETLELEMDMEADLGIDSIKRVEILGAMQSQFPQLPKIETNVLAELRTLGQIIQQMSVVKDEGSASDTVIAAAAAAQSAPGVVETAAPQAEAEAPAGSGPSAAEISTALLQVVSEKTGYPVETLELEMDMEADLGIDSIKRVEILGAIQAQYPELPKPDAAVLGELRTLGQITQFLSAAAPAPSTEVAGASPFELPFEPGIEQGIVTRKILPSPDVLDFTLPAGNVCLITDDGQPSTTQLAEALLSKNWPVVVMRFPAAIAPARLPLPERAVEVELTGLGEPDLQACLSEVASKYGPVAVFIYQDLQDKASEGANPQAMSFPDLEKSLLKLIFLAAKHLKPVLNKAAEHGRSAFMTVTHLDGAFGLGEGGNYTPISGGLFGLVKSLNLEWDSVFCRAVDLHPALDTGQVVNCILAELYDPNLLITEVGYTLTERSTLTLASVPVTGGKK